MQIQSITLKNIGPFKDLTIPFAPLETDKPKVTVFIGNNGSGKTNILKSVVTALSWLPARIRTERGRGLDIPELVINNHKTSALVSINVLAEQNKYEWTLSKTRRGKHNQFFNDFKGVTALAEKYRNHLTENTNINLPLMAFYPVERSVLDIPLRIKKKHNFKQLNAYDAALEMEKGISFRDFFEWFRNREDIENQDKVLNEINVMAEEMEATWELLDKLLSSYNKVSKFVEDSEQLSGETLSNGIDTISGEMQEAEQIIKQLEFMQKNGSVPNPNFDIALQAVRTAIGQFTGFEKVYVQRKPRLQLTISKNGKALNVFQLSQGEKSLMALVGDIARRLSMLNPDLENPLEGQGIVIIDEADLHLHPQWQRQLVARLTQTFPNCQFILSTHSPLIISDSKDIVVYSLENGEMIKIPSQYGQDANTVYLDAMDTAIRNERVTEQLNSLLDLIQNNQLNEARDKLVQLKAELPDNHIELNKAKILITKQELRNEINSKK